ncbi:MAG TPA: DUF1326 domain-containing protein [Candidatus Acidoferrum sp.]|nr:DUF1326 domain-containing protein [Candidatus Acidoferrum sp.]
MRLLPRLLSLPLLVLAVLLLLVNSAAQDKAKPDFDMTASYIEACSCDMFCPCYFNTHSTNHMGMGDHNGEEHFCRASLVLKVGKGSYYKDVKLDGATVWLASDLGSDWSTGKDSWLVVNFDPSVTKEQQTALADILGQLYPIPWQKKAVQTVAFSWSVDTKAGVAHAKMSDGKGEVILEKVAGDDANHEVVISNLKYWGAQSNNGFRMWKSKHEAFEGDGHKFSYDGTNGFLITIHFSGNAKAGSAD